jgi:hypothetical protein
VKTTLEIPDRLFHRAESAAAERGIRLRTLVTEALADKLRTPVGENKPWMQSFGKLRSLHKETVKINRIMAEEFDQLEHPTV